MSYYSILPSQRVTNTTHSFTGQNPDPMKPLQQTPGGFRTREIQPDELVNNQLNTIVDENGRYIQRARARAGAAANASGMANSSLAMGAGEAAAIDAAMPIASQDASTNTGVNAGNMNAENDWLMQRDALNNQMEISRAGNNNALTIAGMNNEENRRQFDLGQTENTRRYDQGFARDQTNRDTDWQRQQERDATQNLNSRNNYIASTIMNNTFSDPSIWRDGPGAMGLANYYSTNFGRLWDTLFTPQAAPQPNP